MSKWKIEIKYEEGKNNHLQYYGGLLDLTATWCCIFEEVLRSGFPGEAILKAFELACEEVASDD